MQIQSEKSISSRNLLWPKWPVWGALTFLVSVFAFFLWRVRELNDGVFIYGLDDAYIHMAVAKNLAVEGVWGINSAEPSSAVSSLTWAVLLAGSFVIGGINLYIPLIWNLVFAAGILFAADGFFRVWGLDPLIRFSAFVFIILCTPLLPLIFSGMEHMLQGFLSLMFLLVTANLVRGMDRTGREKAVFLIVAALLPATRYETSILVAVMCVLIFFQGRRKLAISAMVVSLLPIFVFGMWSIAQGFHFLPNSVLMKAPLSQQPGLKSTISALGGRTLLRVAEVPFLTMGISVSLLMLLGLKHRTEEEKALRILFYGVIAASLLHLQYARIGSLFRYESSLLLLLFSIGFVAFHKLWKEQIRGFVFSYRPHLLTALLLLVVCSAPFANRALLGLLAVPKSTSDIFRQQYQMARFMKRYYKGNAIGANDIGLLAFASETRLIDLFGLSEFEISQARRKNEFSAAVMADIASRHDMQVAVIYNFWFGNDIPSTWHEVAQWRLPERYVLGGDTVSFWAITAEEVAPLREALIEFEPELPAMVTAKYLLE